MRTDSCAYCVRVSCGDEILKLVTEHRECSAIMTGVLKDFTTRKRRTKLSPETRKEELNN